MKNLLRLVLLTALLVGATASLARPAPGHAAGTGGIIGAVFFDADADGIRDATDNGLDAGLTVEIRDAATNGQVFLTVTTTALDGTYAFTALDANTYLVTELSLEALGYTRTTPNTRTVVVGSVVAPGVDFGGTLLMTLSGTIFDDANQDGVRGLGETVIPDALVEVFHDPNGNGLIDSGEPLAGSAVSNTQGNYVVANLWPGAYVMRVQPPGGIGLPAQIAVPIVSRYGGGILRQDVGILIPRGGDASLNGIVWKDLDGDEVLDADEGFIASAALALYRDSNGNGVIDSGESVVGQATSNSQGAYSFSSLDAGAYVLRVDDLTIPAGWIPSHDASLLAFSLEAGQTRELNLGYFDPLAVGPMTVADWKKEIHRSGHPRYTAAEIAAFIASAQTSSAVFPEIVSLQDALLRPAPGDEGRARKEYAALRLNVASNLLLTRTPINLPALTTATTVGGVLTEIEGLLNPPASQLNTTYRRVESLAEALNKGEGVGYGLTMVGVVSRATYRGGDVTSALRRGGSIIDQTLDGPIYLTRWSPGNLDPATNIFRPRVRVRVNAFYNGAVLDAYQKLSDGRLVLLGTIIPPFWNKDVKTDYHFDLWRVSTLGELVSTEIRLVTRDPDGDGGHPEHIKIDAAEIVFDY